LKRKIQNGKECNFELGLISTIKESDVPTYLKDDLGRNQRVYINNDTNMTFVAINRYKVEEKIFDIQEDKKISLNELYNKYLSITGFKVISILNHKIVVQNDTKFDLFSIKR
jgi:predicted rRNA methylase YqxC with S4 and FtsJ domains